MKMIVTFGQEHAHSVNGKTFDKDCVAEIDCENYQQGRKKAFELFDGKFFTTYTREEFLNDNKLKYFPRGIIPVENSTEDIRSGVETVEVDGYSEEIQNVDDS